MIISLESVLDDLELLVRHAAREHKGLPLFIAGHSLGGFYAVHLMAKRPAIREVVTGASFRGRHGGVEKRGRRKTSPMTPPPPTPKNGFGPPIVWYVFHPPLRRCSFSPRKKVKN